MTYLFSKAQLPSPASRMQRWKEETLSPLSGAGITACDCRSQDVGGHRRRTEAGHAHGLGTFTLDLVERVGVRHGVAERQESISDTCQGPELHMGSGLGRPGEAEPGCATGSVGICSHGHLTGQNQLSKIRTWRHPSPLSVPSCVFLDFFFLSSEGRGSEGICLI